ncbi:MAG: putative heat-shock chaperone protein [Bryobacterales bacterium]|nr:putative heat-shock chaperone protein [Bryobacterales bacterium]
MANPSEIRPVIGIDLGTTNCALAYSQSDAVELFSIPQFVHPGEIREEPLLPSFLFLEEQPTVGVLAQRKGLENPGRLVSSAKSWLSYAGVDRNAAILPVTAPDGVSRISPVAASSQYLKFLREAWNTKRPDAPFDTHQVLVTVPASFDAVARDLTLKAAEQAGYEKVVLLEEPQAAFYAWIAHNPNWRELVAVGDLILVIDIGGGTTDFALISVEDQAGQISLRRIAVGDHILLGGDNMDAALAHHVAEGLPKLDGMQFHALYQHCRIAKERLLAEDNEDSQLPITILGRGTSVVGKSMKSKLTRADVVRILTEGFLPAVSIDEEPEEPSATLTEFGLPYASEPAITRHLAHFLRRQSATPTHVLFNGGVFRAQLVRDRTVEILNKWLPRPVTPLVSGDLMRAVAHGATYYGLARQGEGVRVRGGVPHSYYIGIESAAPAVPGRRPPFKALTVVPFGMEEGTGYEFKDRTFVLSVGKRAQFRFFQSSERKEDPPGSLIEDIDTTMEELSPVEALLPSEVHENVPVTLESLVTETGMLELWFVARDGRRWKLEFNVRPKKERLPSKSS